jgi:hypothetical protein
MSDEARLDRIERALEEMAGHVRNAQTDIDDQEQAFTLIKLGFQSNVDAQVSIAKDLSTLKERSISTLVLAAIVPAIVLGVGIVALAGHLLTLVQASPSAMAVLGFAP